MVETIFILINTFFVDIKQDKPLQRQILSSYCQNENLPSCLKLINLYERSNINIKDVEHTYKMACSLNDASSCFSLAKQLLQDFDSKVSSTQKGNLFSTYVLNQDKASKDLLSQALELATKSCKLNLPEACHSVGMYYYFLSQDVGEDLKHASYKDEFLKSSKKYLTLSCELNYAQSCFVLGSYFSSDLQNAIALLSKACDLNDSRACHNLGIIYQDASNPLNDDYKGLEFYKKGCILGEAKSCYNEAGIYGQGKIVKKDLKKALSLLERSCSLKFKEACEAHTAINEQIKQEKYLQDRLDLLKQENIKTKNLKSEDIKNENIK